MINLSTLRRPVPALAAGVLAVAVVGAGSATAATFVTSKDVKDSSLRSVDVKDGSLRVKDLTGRAVTTLQKGGPQGATGATGAQGPKGDTGAQGPKGADGVSGYEVKTFDYIAGIGHRDGYDGMDSGYAGVGGGAIATVACSTGKEALGGGYWFRGGANGFDSPALTSGVAVTASFPGRMDWNTNTPKADRNDGWIIQVNKPQNVNPGDLTMYVICANVTP